VKRKETVIEVATIALGHNIMKLKRIVKEDNNRNISHKTTKV